MPLLTKEELGNVPFAHLLMRVFSIDKVNALYDRNLQYRGPDFARAVLDDLGISYEVENSRVLDSLPDGPFITISNHPYGHIDGIILVDLFGHLRGDYKVMVNRILGRIGPMTENFICVDPAGSEKASPTGESISGVKDALRHVRGGHPLGIFPSGAVSDLDLKDRCVRDREWQESVIRLIRRLHVPVLPVTFRDGNSAFYYSLGLISWRVRLLRLPAEVFNKKGRTIRLALGDLISPEEQDGFDDTEGFRTFLRQKVYGLK